jgi:AbiV family abortive infection protein
VLEDNDGRKPKIVQLPRMLLEEAIQSTRNGIIKKLESASLLLAAGGSHEIAAGLYTFALEEYGKLLILKRSYRVRSTNDYQICYAKKFADHDVKFDVAGQELDDREFADCILLNQNGSFSADFSARSFHRGDMVDMKARLAIFYTDFVQKDNMLELEKVPQVDKEQLNTAISKLLVKVNQTDSTLDALNQFPPNCMQS